MLLSLEMSIGKGVSMERFWKEVNDLLGANHVSVETPASGMINKIMNKGYIEIYTNDLIYRSVPVEHGIMWLCWDPFHALGHFSQITDENAVVKWIEKEKPLKSLY